MKTVDSLKEMRELARSWPAPVGFVPTMGALHEGHHSLCARARRECGLVVASIFVNPTQFNDPRDLEKYPRTLEADLDSLRAAGVDYVFLPRAEEIYADGYRYVVSETQESRVLCGAHRPGHFDGVLTVVLKLFNLVRPRAAYFGEKDYQQLRLIGGMVDALCLDLEIVPCPTVREPDGLAMSSRNRRLRRDEREIAPRLHEILVNAPSAEGARELLLQAGFRVDYVEEHWGRRFGAAFLGEVRLIDNVEI